ncbi:MULTISPECIES: hypothetical protein [Brevibacillus]|nr:hypothetical protein [Brevibacillus borstelensis]MED1744396.1 hypothetical protein [Brevibacillus borstelensis]MED1852692.1 hypothetical protein [Brevibacillus borstelensis]MED1873624.1 hypothetical protein [Brevibacillus borstelensis]MED1883316.1 hypothetical protein [Brevibacillus borstelensis]MED2010597.1 hypothetical protein [Brevibacillus borstelensis]
MMTPCVFKRGMIWILFFIISLIVIPFFSDDTPSTPAPTVNNASR